MNFNKEIIEKATILRALVGSTAHGISIGNDDRDEMGVCIEPINYAIGLNEFEQLIFRTAVEREHRHDVKSQPGDLDLTIYSLRKFIRLALKGNPSIVMLFYIKNPIFITELGVQLQGLAPYIISKKTGKAFLGYLTAQRYRILGERGGAHGKLDGHYAKYAAHMVRLGMQGREFMSTGKVTIPMNESDAKFCRDVRSGIVDIETVIKHTENLEYNIENLLKTSDMQDEPNKEFVEKWMIDSYWKAWKNEI